MKISIITPCFNAEKYIKETAESVLSQSAVVNGAVELEYIICDGGSSDKTVDIIKSLKSKHIQIISEKDSGMYDALAKGLRAVSGDVCAYINAGDYYHYTAFGVIADIFTSKNIKWLTGYNVTYNEKSEITRVILPFKYRKSFFKYGLYGTRLPFVQQESTFWHSSLNEQLDLNLLASLKRAGDYYIWLQFSKHEDLKIVQSYLGGFKKHSGQISESMDLYLDELKSFTDNSTITMKPAILIDRLLWNMGDSTKKFFNKDQILVFNESRHIWF